MGKFSTLKLVQSRDEIKANPSKIGQAVYDIMSKPQYDQTAEETTAAMTSKYYQELYKTIDDHKAEFQSPYYIVVFRKKEPWTINTLHQWYVSRQSRPSAKHIRGEHPHHDYDVWKIDTKACTVDFQWTMLSKQDCGTVMQHPELYDPELVATIKMFNEGKLD